MKLNADGVVERFAIKWAKLWAGKRNHVDIRVAVVLLLLFLFVSYTCKHMSGREEQSLHFIKFMMSYSAEFWNSSSLWCILLSYSWVCVRVWKICFTTYCTMLQAYFGNPNNDCYSLPTLMFFCMIFIWFVVSKNMFKIKLF